MEEMFIKLGTAIVGSMVFFVVGFLLLMCGWYAFDWKLKKINFQDELQKGNAAVGIFVAGLLVALAIVIASAIH